MLKRPTAALLLGALAVLGTSPAGAETSAPAPAATPLQTIVRMRSTPLCTGLRAMAPAVGRVLQSDRIIAKSKPLFHDFVRASSDANSKPLQDMTVMRLEQLVGPLVRNTQEVDRLLSNPAAFPKHAHGADDRKVLEMRAQIQAVNDQQKRALDVINGFVATQQLAELQAEGHEYDSALAPNVKGSPPPNPAPTTAPADILNAGVMPSGDISRKYDPRYLNTGNQLGENPLNAFEQAISNYQVRISGTEQQAAKSVIAAIPLCGGHVPAQPAPAPSPSP